MNNWCSQFDVAHALTTNLRASYFNAALFANDALKAHTLVLTAVALPVTCRSECLFTEQTITLWAQCAVVNGFRLLYFTT